ncbi:Proteasome assembly chaperone 3 [Phytophthora pseudosyringae]|uniref:Proteasome assembly chaperone 3 n=1 Tax=Phytophthora pseudosyringae TaxID=221518 RepID=A0A8T1VM20_9STRA|nr:Proteasome assembly chaperone 3 [Phytophthora pseudosyringae]
MAEATTPPALHTKQDRKDINGVPTDIAVSIFADRVFIAVTQLGTFGTLVEAHQKDSISGKLQPDIHIRLGRRDDPLLLVYARQFLEHFGVPVGLPILAAIGLKDRSSGTFEVVMQSVKELFGQAQSAQEQP